MGAKNVHPGLIVFDAQDDFADTKSTQNLTSASRFVAGHKYLAEQLSCFVLGVAHDTQDGKKMSGNVRFYSSCDISISVKPERNGNSSGDSVTTVVNEKAKPGGIFEFKPFSFQALEQEWDEPLWDDDDPDLPIIDPDTGLQKTKLVKTYVVIPRADPEDGGDLSADPVDDGSRYSGSSAGSAGTAHSSPAPVHPERDQAGTHRYIRCRQNNPRDTL